MLSIIGLGLGAGDIPSRGMEALESAEMAYAELYTNSVAHDLESLEEETGTPIEMIDRGEVEEEDRVLVEARERDVAFLVSGDPLAATTHQDILFRAMEEGIETRVFHAPSVFTAVAETGLSLYKFGRTTTLTVQNGEVPESVFETVESNREKGLHTLVLVDPEIELPDALVGLGGRFGDEVIVCSALGTSDRDIFLSSPGGLEAGELSEAVSLVVPGELSGNERERLETIKK